MSSPPPPVLQMFARKLCVGVALGPTQPALVATAWKVKGRDTVDQDLRRVPDTRSGMQLKLFNYWLLFS